MEKKYCSHIIFHLLFNHLSVSILLLKMAAAQAQPVPIRVGVVVDKGNYVGQMGLNCISMALSDFYSTQAHYKTRLEIHGRDSKKDAVGAAAAALDLLKNVQVQAILGPLTSVQANFMINLGRKAQVPVITFSATSPCLTSIRSQYFFRAAVKDSSQVEAISAIVQTFGWRQAVPIYADNEFGVGIIPSLADALEEANAHVPYRSVIPSVATTDDQIDAELYKLKALQTRVFVVHMEGRLGSRLFTRAKQAGMMSGDYVWIATAGIINELNSMPPSVIESMLGVIGVRPYVAKTKKLDSFTVRYKKRLQQQNPTSLSPDLNIFGLWAYDSAVALAMATEQARITSTSFQKTNVAPNSTDLEAFGVSDAGPKLIQALSRITFKGLFGNFQLVDGQLQSPPYQIVNIVGPGARVVAYWTKEDGIIKELNFRNANSSTYSAKRSNLGSIIWPGDKKSPPKGWVIPTNEKKLRVGVPVRDGFTEFVHVTWNPDNSTEVKGYCIDVFDAVMAALPYGVPYEYIPFATSDHKDAGSHDDMVYQVYLGNYDAVAGDVTIVANRSQFVDFTLPFTESGVSMVVPIKDHKVKNAWVFLKPLTWQLWLTSSCSFVFIGFLVWILEHRINEDFRGPFWHQVGTIFWFASSTIVLAHRERVVSNCGRFVLSLWFLVALILTQSYTASLTSMLTVQQLQPAVTDVNELIRNKEYVGYQDGSFVHGLLKRMNFDESRMLTYRSAEECDELLSKGSRNGGIAAAFDEIPYMKIFLAKYCSKYTMVGPTYKTDGFGFVFLIGSPLVPDISRAILNITEGEKMLGIEKKWFGDNRNCANSSNQVSSNSLGPESFWGLFMIVGIAGVLAFMVYTFRFLREHWDVVGDSNLESTIWSKIKQLSRRFDSKDLNSHTFKNIGNEKRNGGDFEAGRRAMETHESPQESPLSFSLTSPPIYGPASPNLSNYSEQNVNITREQRTSVEIGITSSRGEAFQEGTEQENEPIADPNRNEEEE